MYRKIADFETDWAHESESTLKLLANLRDESLSQRVSQDGRTLGFLGWHLVVSLGMAAEAGLPFEIPGDFGSHAPAGASALKQAYEKYSAEMMGLIKANWKDANLLEEVQMYGMTWTRGYALLAMVKHQAHHRGQMTVLMRQAGLQVPGPYGPSREEWAAMGMEPLP
jgi:uncharacterized damage-inducible protein DinB